MSARWSVVAATAGLTLGLVGCGGTSKADFVQDADPVCSKTNGELAAVSKPATFKQLGESAGKVAVSTDNQVKALRDLDQPKAGKDDLEAVLMAMERTVAASRKVESGVTADDGKTVEAATAELRQAATTADDGARAYGLAQCGKGSRDAVTNLTDATNPLLKQQLIAKANAICKESSDKVDRLPETPDTPQGLIRTLNDSLPLIEKAFIDLKALHAPQPDKPAYDEFLTAGDRATDLLRDIQAAGTGNQARLAQAFNAFADAATESSRKAAAFGLRECTFEE